MVRRLNTEAVVQSGTVIPDWFLDQLLETLRRSAAAHQVVATTYPSEIAKGPTAWGARMGESTICAAYLRAAIDEINALKGQE